MRHNIVEITIGWHLANCTIITPNNTTITITMEQITQTKWLQTMVLQSLLTKL